MDSVPVQLYFEKLSTFESVAEIQKDVLAGLARELYPTASFIQEAPTKLGAQMVEATGEHLSFRCEKCTISEFSSRIDKTTIEIQTLGPNKRRATFRTTDTKNDGTVLAEGDKVGSGSTETKWIVDIKKLEIRYTARAVRDLPKGTEFSANDFSVHDCGSSVKCSPTNSYSSLQALQVAFAQQKTKVAKKDLKAESEFTVASYYPKLLVLKDGLVSIKLQNKNGELSIETEGKSMENGSLNSFVKLELKNQRFNTKATTITGKVTGPAEVSIEY